MSRVLSAAHRPLSLLTFRLRVEGLLRASSPRLRTENMKAFFLCVAAALLLVTGNAQSEPTAGDVLNIARADETSEKSAAAPNFFDWF